MTLILCPNKLDQLIVDKIEAVNDSIELIATDDEKKIEKYWPEAEILFSAKFDATELEKAKNLKWVQATSAGVDYYMFDEFVKSDILLTNVRGMHGQTIGEHVLMMMLVISKNFLTSVKNQKQQNWQRYQTNIIKNKNLVIVGLGGIGRQLAKLANSIGVNVIGVDIENPQIDFLDEFYKTKDMKKAFGQADFVVMATPLTDKTYHMISKDEFAAMKETASFINIARGKVVDQEALYQALTNKVIKSAAIDVFENEPLAKDDPLWQLDNIIITPHIAGTMPDYMDNASDIFVNNLKLYLDNKTLENLVDKNKQF